MLHMHALTFRIRNILFTKLKCCQHKIYPPPHLQLTIDGFTIFKPILGSHTYYNLKLKSYTLEGLYSCYYAFPNRSSRPAKIFYVVDVVYFSIRTAPSLATVNWRHPAVWRPLIRTPLVFCPVVPVSVISCNWASPVCLFHYLILTARNRDCVRETDLGCNHVTTSCIFEKNPHILIRPVQKIHANYVQQYV
jgi:hypothetical protein